MAKRLLAQTYLGIPAHPSGEKRQLWILVSSFELTFLLYSMTLTLRNLWFYSLGWLEFFHQDLHRQLFSLENGFKINCCMFNLTFLCRLDGENRSVSAPLVSIFSKKAFLVDNKVLWIEFDVCQFFSKDKFKYNEKWGSNPKFENGLNLGFLHYYWSFVSEILKGETLLNCIFLPRCG